MATAITNGWRGVIAGVALSLCAGLAELAHAQTAPAGTPITNVATLRFTADGEERQVSSNTVSTRVDTLLDVTVAVEARIPVTAAQTAIVAPFVVTNAGNANERFTLSHEGPAGVIAEDTDGNGRYDAAADRTIDAIALAGGAAGTVFVVVGGPIAATTQVALTATAATGHGAAGTVFAGAGAGGGDAVVGRTGARATAQAVLVRDGAAPTLFKSQSVVAPDGSARVMPGSIITYRLDARFPGATGDAAIVDPVPFGTVFVPGSITLDGQPLTDAADGDGGRFDGAAVRVALGTITSATTRTVLFQTRIQ